MKLLCTGDLHINSWIPFSTIDEYGRPSRLRDYIKLAKLISDLAEKEKCDAIILAGDISESAIQPPQVLDTIGDFLRICSKNIPVHLIHGQHDINTKSDKINSKHSILKEICKDLEIQNVNYYAESTLTKLGLYSAYFQPWIPGHELEGPDADIFIGHGIVTGCSNLDGYIFMNGFDKNDLMEKYRLSIIGDIHKRQEHYSDIFENRLVLQPGSSIQNSWKDHEDCGIYTVELTGVNNPIEVKFHSIHNLAPNTFHRFTYDSPIESELIHSRPKIGLKKKDQEIKKSLEIKRDNTVIYETCNKLIEEDKELNNKNLIIKFLIEVFENTSLTSDKVIATSRILEVEAENFLSIDKIKFNMEEFPRSCVIIGHNGSGKTTIPEAIYWCLTGNTTKSLTISDIINIYKEDDFCYVKVSIIINNQKFTINRKRKGKTSSLEISDADGNIIKYSSIRETQAELYKLLGLQEWQLHMFSYFSAEKTNLFADLNDSSKNDLVSQIVGLDFVESMRLYSKDKKTNTRNESMTLDGIISEKQSVISQLEKKLKKLKSESLDNSPIIKTEITKLKNKSSLIKETKQQEYIAFTKTYGDIDENTDKTESLSEDYYKLQSKLESSENKRVILENNIKKYKKQIKEAISGFCPVCKQKLHDKDLIKNLKTKLVEDMNLVKELPNIEELKTKLTDLHDKIKQKQIKSKEFKSFTLKQNQYDKDLNEIPLQISELEKQLIIQDKDTSIIENLEKEIQDNNELLDETYKEIHEINKKVKSWSYLETNLFKRNGNLSKELNRQGSKLIQKCIDEILVGLGITITINKDLSLSGVFHKNRISYEGMSSGQKRLTDIVLMVALNNLFSKIYNLEDGVIGFAVYDEILSFLDDKYIDLAKQVVDQSISRKILIITHDSKLMNMYDSRIKVSLNNLGSTYIKSWE